MLTDDLKTIVIDQLKTWQLGPGRDGVREQVAVMMNPTLLLGMIQRTQAFKAKFKDARDKGRLHPFVMPFMAAMAFESVFQSCAAFWLSAGDPDSATPGVLRQSVQDFVDMQVEAFGACLGLT